MNNPDRTPPQSMETEQAILGSIIAGIMGIEKAKEVLTPSVFYYQNHKKIFSVMLKMHEEEKAIDIVTIVNEIEKAGLDIKPDKIAELVECQGIEQYLDDYAKILNEKKIYRDTISELSSVVNSAFAEAIPIADMLSKVETFTSKIGDDCDRADIKRKKKGNIIRIKDLSERISEYHEKGLRDIGIHPGSERLGMKWERFGQRFKVVKKYQTVITGIPGHGKTEIVDCIKLNTAAEHGWKWAIFSPESYPWETYVQKQCERFSGKSFFAHTTIGERKEIEGWLNEHIFLIEPEEDNITVSSLLNLVGEAKAKHDIDGFIFDPWNEIEDQLHEGESETKYIGRMLAKIRRFSRKNDLAEFIVAHPTKLKKDPKTNSYPVPTPYDIDGSSHWRNKADNCLATYRYYGSGNDQVNIHIQKIKLKQHGFVGMVKTRYEVVSGRFIEIEDDEDANIKPEAKQQTMNF